MTVRGNFKSVRVEINNTALDKSKSRNDSVAGKNGRGGGEYSVLRIA